MSSLNLRRLRQDSHVRALTREVHVQLDQLIQPLFVGETNGRPEAIPGLTGVHQDTPDSLLRQVEQDLKAGVDTLARLGVEVVCAREGEPAKLILRRLEQLRLRETGR